LAAIPTVGTAEWRNDIGEAAAYSGNVDILGAVAVGGQQLRGAVIGNGAAVG
jgi:hypothetical protein